MQNTRSYQSRKRPSLSFSVTVSTANGATENIVDTHSKPTRSEPYCITNNQFMMQARIPVVPIPKVISNISFSGDLFRRLLNCSPPFHPPISNQRSCDLNSNKPTRWCEFQNFNLALSEIQFIVGKCSTFYLPGSLAHTTARYHEIHPNFNTFVYNSCRSHL